MRLGWLLGIMVSALLAGCVTNQPRSTRLTNVDFEDLAAMIAGQLRASDVINERSPADEIWTIAMARVENLSGDFIPESEQWWLMERVRSSLPIRTLSEEHALRLVIPVERLTRLRGRSPELEQAGFDRAPTHRMEATIRSIARVGDSGRTDFYSTEFSLIDLSDGEVIWSGAGEIKRVAFGRSWD